MLFWRRYNVGFISDCKIYYQMIENRTIAAWWNSQTVSTINCIMHLIWIWESPVLEIKLLKTSALQSGKTNFWVALSLATYRKPGRLRSPGRLYTTLFAHTILTNQYFSILFSDLVRKFFNPSLSTKTKIMRLKSSEETEENHWFLTIFTKLILISSGNIHLQPFWSYSIPT